MVFSIIVRAVWFILPAYVANSAAIDVSAVPFLAKYKTPVDFSRTFRGRRILGDGKTWRGLFSAVVVATLVGGLQANYSTVYGIAVPQMSWTLGFLLGLGAMVGDMTASFLKRQAGLPRGAMVPIIDQLDYIIAAFLFAWVVVPADFSMLVVVCIITLPLHVIANLVAYAIKLKKVPW